MNASTPHGLARLESALGSLKARITMGGIMALVVGIGLITTLLVGRAEHDLLESQRQRELSESVRTAALLARNVIQLQRALESVADVLDEETLRDPARLKLFLQSKPVLRNLFANLYVATNDGQVLLSVDNDGKARVVMNLQERAYFRKTLAEGRALVSDPVDGSLSGGPIVVFTQPARNTKGVYAVVGGTLRLSSRDLLDGLVDMQEADANALIVVSDAQGRILAHPRRDMLLRPLSDEPRLATAWKAWQADGAPVEAAGLVLPGVGEIASAAGVPGPDWMVWRARPEADILAPFKHARRQSMLWAASLIALLSAATFGLLWWLLQPLTLLERRARHLFDGEIPADQGWPEADGEIGRLAKVLRHVSMERVELERINSEFLIKLRSVMRAAPIGIGFVRDRRFELVSDELCRMLGHDEHKLLGEPVDFIVVPPAEDALPLAAREDQAFAAGTSYVGEWQIQRSDGTVFWGRLRSRPVDAQNVALGAIWTLVDIDEQYHAREALEWTAAHDMLTGLGNRQLFEQEAQRLIANVPRSIPSAMVFIDLDHFKAVNDTAGHLSGDAVLRQAAEAITARVRSGDLAARLGGDEFALLLENCTHDAALGVAQDIVTSIAAIHVPWRTGPLRIGASIGVASLTPDILMVEDWVQAADAACYAAKAAGRGVVRFG